MESGGLVMSPKGRVLLAMIACALVGACDSAPSSAPKTQAEPGAGKPAPKTDALPQEMVAAVAAGKTATAVNVHFALGASPQVGRDLPVDIAIVPRQKFELLSAKFEPQGAMTLSSGNVLSPVAGVAADKIVHHKVVLQPSQDGLFMMTATVETQDEQGTMTRVFFIPIMVAAQAGAAAAPSAPSPGAPTG
jgi:hypothetical protein